MIVTDIVTVLGHGNVVCCDDKTELVNNHVKIGGHQPTSLKSSRLGYPETGELADGD
jgi:hypothetical protein